MSRYRLLIIRGELGTGGVARSVMTLLSMIDYNKVDVDLLILNQKKPSLGSIPEQVNIIKTSTKNPYGTFFCRKPWRELVDKPYLLFQRVISHIISKLFRNNYYKYRFILNDNSIGIKKYYDIVMAIQDNCSLLYMLEKIKATKKIYWYHKWKYAPIIEDYKFHKGCFFNVDYIYAVSEDACEEFINRFPCHKDKIHVLNNPVNEQYIINKSNENIEQFCNTNTTIVSVGRLSKVKGFDMAVVSCDILIKRGYDVTWYIVGDGPERSRIQALINEYGVKKNVCLLGTKINPYPYIKKADIYVQPSYVETFCYTIAEAKILKIPIVSTDTLGAKKQIINGQNGILVNKTPEAIAKGIIRIIKNNNLAMVIRSNLENEQYSSDSFFRALM